MYRNAVAPEAGDGASALAALTAGMGTACHPVKARLGDRLRPEGPRPRRCGTPRLLRKRQCTRLHDDREDDDARGAADSVGLVQYEQELLQVLVGFCGDAAQYIAGTRGGVGLEDTRQAVSSALTSSSGPWVISKVASAWTGLTTSGITGDRRSQPRSRIIGGSVVGGT